MQRKGNAIRKESQVKNQISIGIDMGGSLWATAVQDWEAGKMSYYGRHNKFRNFSRFAGAVQKNRKN